MTTYRPERREYFRQYMAKRRDIDKPPRSSRLTDPQIDEAQRLYESGWSTDRIGNHLKCSGATVWYQLKKRNVVMRPAGASRETASASWKQRMQRRGVLAQATNAAAAFEHRSLIELPAHLQAAFDEHLADVRAERGTAWQAGIGSVSDRSAG